MFLWALCNLHGLQCMVIAKETGVPTVSQQLHRPFSLCHFSVRPHKTKRRQIGRPPACAQLRAFQGFTSPFRTHQPISWKAVASPWNRRTRRLGRRTCAFEGFNMAGTGTRSTPRKRRLTLGTPPTSCQSRRGAPGLARPKASHLSSVRSAPDRSE